MATELLIRDSTPADLSALRRIFRRSALTNEGDRKWIAAHPEEFRIDEANVIEGRTRVAVVEGRIVGFATLVDNELEDVFTDPDWMRRGIATALVRDAATTVDRIDVTRTSTRKPSTRRPACTTDRRRPPAASRIECTSSAWISRRRKPRSAGGRAGSLPRRPGVRLRVARQAERRPGQPRTVASRPLRSS